ncbi:MAG: hypothetical protein H8E55_47120 [Pelagibacterales bacterium]|nr:hypothetical protein [Pelagibacterales bacterium]
MKRFIDSSLRAFCGGDNISFNLSKFARARLTKFLKDKKYKKLVELSKSNKKPRNYMKMVNDMCKDWDKQEEPHRKEEIRLFLGANIPSKEKVKNEN